MRRVAYVLAFFAALALALAACASDKATGLPTGPTEAPEGESCTEAPIDMNDQLKFVPETCTAKAGETVTWVTVGGAPHTVTAEDQKTFDSGTTDLVEQGEEFTFTFTTPGSYPYFCRLHAAPGARSGMVGTINVEPA